VYTTNVDGPGISDVPLDQAVMIDGVAVTYFSTSTPKRIYRSPAMVRRLRETVSSFDIVHIHAMFLWPGLAASKEASRRGVPYIVSPRGMLVPELIKNKSRLVKTMWLNLFDRRMIRQAAALHVTSTREAQDIEALGLKFTSLVNIPNGIDLPRKIDDVPIDENGYVLFLGRLDPKKSLEVLIDAMLQIPDSKLLIAGDGEPGYVKELKDRVRANKLAPRVEFLGHLDDTIKWSYYRNAAVFVLPSISENFANAVLEAMAMRCPVIVTSGVGLADVVEHNECGFVVNRNPKDVADAINMLLQQPELQDKYGRNGERVARDEFSWKKVADQMKSAYSDLSGNDNAATQGAVEEL
jgi:glycosyltransferase involved in cell wall biosynthesis